MPAWTPGRNNVILPCTVTPGFLLFCMLLPAVEHRNDGLRLNSSVQHVQTADGSLKIVGTNEIMTCLTSHAEKQQLTGSVAARAECRLKPCLKEVWRKAGTIASLSLRDLSRQRHICVHLSDSLTKLLLQSFAQMLKPQNWLQWFVSLWHHRLMSCYSLVHSTWGLPLLKFKDVGQQPP